MEIRPGQIINNRYRVIKEIGQGGLGTVYLADDRALQKRIVIKRVAVRPQGDSRKEVDILKNLNHQGLPQVHDILKIDRDVYTFMDYIEGRDLDYYIEHKIHLSEEVLLKWFCQITEILEYLHTREIPILHSDIKPGNIMITRQGEPYLIDFNVSLDGRNKNKIVGISPCFAAPEQYAQAMNLKNTGRTGGVAVDGRMDLYSLAATFYTLMSGVFPSPNGPVPVPLTLMKLPYSMAFRALIDKAMERNPAKRFKSAEAMLRAASRIEEMDPEYHRLTLFQVYMAVPLVLFITVGILLIGQGRSLQLKQRANALWDSYNVSVLNHDFTGIINSGNVLLSDETVSGSLGKDPAAKAKLLYTIGSAYFEEEDFGMAVAYFEDAVELDPQTVYYRDLAVAEARSGKLQEAHAHMETAQEMGLDYVSAMYLQAEIYVKEGRSEDALAYLNGLSAQDNRDLMAKICMLKGTLQEQAGNLLEARSSYQSLNAVSSSRTALRKLAGVDMALAESTSLADRTSILLEAERCYSSLCDRTGASYTDQVNYGLCLRALGRYADSNTVFQNTIQQYPDDSRCEMWICFNDLDLLNSTGNAVIESDLRILYVKLQTDYSVNGASDMHEDMETLSALLQTRGIR